MNHWGDHTSADGQHALLTCAGDLSSTFDKATGINPTFMTPAEKKTAITAYTALVARAQGVLAGLLATADDVADGAGARNVADWYAAHARLDYRTASAIVRVAKSLDTGHPHVQAALLEGAIGWEAARTLALGLDDLPGAEVGPELMEKAELHLLAQAEDFRPRELRILVRKIFEVLAPEAWENLERKALENEERQAAKRIFTRFRPNGDGSTRVTHNLPDAIAHRLNTYLEARTAPRQGATLDHPGTALSHDQRLGHAFVELLENLPTEVLPLHGGTTTSVIVTMTLAELLNNGPATLDNGDRISPGEARRLACQAGIIPAVLGGKSEVLDLGRTQRLFNTPQRKALAIRDGGCRTEGCTVPATWCEAHHAKESWSQGGRTDLKDGALLCSHHHHRAHDPAYVTTRLPNGDFRFHRRT